MSLGSFVQGAFKGYAFGEDAKDRRIERKRGKERWNRDTKRWEWEQEGQEWKRGDREWTEETRDYTRGVRDHNETSRSRTERDWNEADELRDELRDIDHAAVDSFGNPVPETPPGGAVRVPLAPQGEQGAPAPDILSPAVPGVDMPRRSSADPLTYGADVPTTRQRGPLMDSPALSMPETGTGGDTLQGGHGNDILQGGGGTAFISSRGPARTGPGPQIVQEGPDGPAPQVAMANGPGQPEQPPTFFRGMGEPPVPGQDDGPGAPRRAPRRPESVEEATLNRVREESGEATRREGPTTRGGGAMTEPGAPDMPHDRRVPAGPEAGMPERQIARTTSDQRAGGLSPDNQRGAAGQPPTGPETPRFASLAPSEDVARSQPGSSDTAVGEVDPEASKFIQDVQGIARTGDIEQALSKIKVGLATGKYGASGTPIGRALGAVGDYFSETPEGGEANAAARAATGEAQTWYQGDEARALFEGRPELLEAAAADPIGFYQNRDTVASDQPPAAQDGQPPAPPPGSAAAAEAPREAPTAPGAPAQDGAPQQGGRASMPAAVAAQFQQLPSPRMALGDGGAQIGQPRGALGDTQALSQNANADQDGSAPRASPQQIERGSAAFLQHYRETAIPQKIEALIRAGKTEEAYRLQEFLESERTQDMQKSYADAVTAASLGDERGFFDHMSTVFNSFDDGYALIPEQSDLSKNEAGETVVTLALRNTETGEVFNQEFSGGAELIEQVIAQMDPAAVFERLQGQAEARRASSAEQHEWEIGESRRRIEKGWDNEQDRQAVANDIREGLLEYDHRFAGLSEEEKVMRIEEEMRVLRAVEGRQGGGAPAPVYTGQ